MEQESLFEPLQPTQETIRIDEVAPWSNDGARSPIKGSIKALGMLDPVTVQALPAGWQHRYRVRAGKRRLTSCRDLGLETVPAVVLPVEMGEIEAALVPLAENSLRRENPLHEAREIQAVFDACRASGTPEDDIRPYLTGFGFPASVIDQRLKLLTLPPEIQLGSPTAGSSQASLPRSPTAAKRIRRSTSISYKMRASSRARTLSPSAQSRSRTPSSPSPTRSSSYYRMTPPIAPSGHSRRSWQTA